MTAVVQQAGRAPAGFDEQNWRRFERTGLLVVQGALSPDEVRGLRDAVDAECSPAEWNIVERNQRFAELIDHPAHVGYVYDVYGEMLKLLRSEFFRREPGHTTGNPWHFDGPRLVPFQVFVKRLPLRIKVGYWLTPLPTAGMGNLIYLPGSHWLDRIPQYQTHQPRPDEERLIVPAGAMTLMWGGLWHRVDSNFGDLPRRNVFLEYGPSWLVSSDRLLSTPAWLDRLPRARRIIMRSYSEPNDAVKPPAGDVPLYRPREDEADTLAHYSSVVALALRKRSTWIERHGLA